MPVLQHTAVNFCDVRDILIIIQYRSRADRCTHTAVHVTTAEQTGAHILLCMLPQRSRQVHTYCCAWYGYDILLSSLKTHNLVQRTERTLRTAAHSEQNSNL